MYTLKSEDPSGYWFGRIDWFGRDKIINTLYIPGRMGD